MSSELKVTTGDIISSQNDLNVLIEVAQDRDRWKHLVQDITYREYRVWYEKEIEKAEARRAAKLASQN